MMEWELAEIKQEIYSVEEKITELKSVDTSKLYFNVDGMKKLTEVKVSVDRAVELIILLYFSYSLSANEARVDPFI